MTASKRDWRHTLNAHVPSGTPASTAHRQPRPAARRSTTELLTNSTESTGTGTTVAGPPATGSGSEPLRLLAVLGEPVGANELRRRIEEHADGLPVELRIVAPALARTAFDQGTGNVDRAIAEVERWLPPLLAELRRSGLEVQGKVGDANPIVAIGDALRQGPADEILVVTTEPGEDGAWLEEEMFDRARASFDQPISHLVVESGGDLVEIAHSGPGRDPVSRWRLLARRLNRGRRSIALTAAFVIALIGAAVIADLLLGWSP